VTATFTREFGLDTYDPAAAIPLPDDAPVSIAYRWQNLNNKTAIITARKRINENYE